MSPAGWRLLWCLHSTSCMVPRDCRAAELCVQVRSYIQHGCANTKGFHTYSRDDVKLPKGNASSQHSFSSSSSSEPSRSPSDQESCMLGPLTLSLRGRAKVSSVVQAQGVAHWCNQSVQQGAVADWHCSSRHTVVWWNP